MSALSLLFVALGITFVAAPAASAQPDPQVDGGELPPVQVDAVAAPPVALAAPTSPDASPAAVAACGQFAEALDAAATYYGEFADALDENAQARYADPTVNDSNTLGRTALRQGAVLAMSAANTPGLAPEIANPMRMWSVDATKLLVKMGLRSGGNTLDLTANELNSDALSVQEACAAAGTHA
ncbi:hypothetical protein JRC04_08795 [Mycolicibacterium sp. S2-37]|uniref:hypothetical protein n=1 Tax=Mycolicibacterium sp. S2-37 TaxID=2810297 RepID=UPI001A94BBE7|nr:hypothetical protein [Mycolicibacterium sp. S2-37]MBO0677556.1 hypothetical protein [Mycolicibacterium sp. S2-37]